MRIANSHIQFEFVYICVRANAKKNKETEQVMCFTRFLTEKLSKKRRK